MSGLVLRSRLVRDRVRIWVIRSRLVRDWDRILGSCLVRARVFVWLVFGLVSGFVSGFCLGSCWVRVVFVWFVSGSCLVF